MSNETFLNSRVTSLLMQNTQLQQRINSYISQVSSMNQNLSQLRADNNRLRQENDKYKAGILRQGGKSEESFAASSAENSLGSNNTIDYKAVIDRQLEDVAKWVTEKRDFKELDKDQGVKLRKFDVLKELDLNLMQVLSDAYKYIAIEQGRQLGLSEDDVMSVCFEVRKKILNGELLPSSDLAITTAMLQQWYGEDIGARIHDALIKRVQICATTYFSQTNEERAEKRKDNLLKVLELNATAAEQVALKAKREEEARLKKEAEERTRKEAEAARVKAAQDELAKSIDWVLFDIEETKMLTHAADGSINDVSKFVIDFNRDRGRNKGHRTWRLPTWDEFKSMTNAKVLLHTGSEKYSSTSWWGEHYIKEFGGGAKERVSGSWTVSARMSGNQTANGKNEKNLCVVLVRSREPNGDQPKKIFGLF